MIRRVLSPKGMYSLCRCVFGKVVDGRMQRPGIISLGDATLSAMAMFSWKDSSLLQFDQDVQDDAVLRANIENLFGVEQVPRDTTMREILDEIETKEIRPAFKKIFAAAQRGKALEKFVYLNGAYLVALDGTGFFSSSSVHCDQCCRKEHRDGMVTYYHQMLSAVVVHPDLKQVIPLMPEPISGTDGANKNDCERSAAERLLRDFRREHPHLKVIITEDGLSSNGPHILLLKELGMGFILSCKPGDHAHLFEFIAAAEKLGDVRHGSTSRNGETYEFRWMNGVPLNQTHDQLLVNFLECEITKKDGKKVRFSWVTDIELSNDNLFEIMRGGRARWKIENETFNTLKNQGYAFEHNFGHGYKNLSNNLAVLMMLVFLIDQLSLFCCDIFQKAFEKVGRISYLWQRMRSYLSTLVFRDWNEIMKAIAFGMTTQFRINSS